MIRINNKDNTFTERAEEFGLADQNISTQASFFDYDKDGDLDCIIANETEYYRTPEDYIEQNIIPNKELLSQNSTRLLENQNGKFIDKTSESGILQFSYNLGVVTADFNEDGWTDIYLTNDYEISDALFINQKDGTFKDEVKSKTKQISWFAMGVDYNDINNDGLADLSAVDMTPKDHIRSKVMMRPMNSDLFWHHIKTNNRQYAYMFNTLQLNNGNGTFSNIANMAGTSRSEWSWSNLLADFDNDTYKDNYIGNGIRKDFINNDAQRRLKSLKISRPQHDPRIKTFHQTLAGNRIENEIFRNNGDLTFKKANKDWGLTSKTFTNGAVYVDLDRDGDLDIVTNNIDDFAGIHRNNSETLSQNHFLQFQFPKNATGYNGKIKLFLDNGEILLQEYSPTRGFSSSVDHLLHFGLGKNTIIPKAEVIWPNGNIEYMTDLAVDQIINLNIKNSTNPKPETQTKSLITELNPDSLGLNFVHIENEYNDFDKQTLLPYKHSTSGPSMAKGDFNNDGLEDLFIGNSTNQTSILYFQTKGSQFIKSKNPIFNGTKKTETVDVLPIDFDNDGDLDILTINGSYEFEENSQNLKDILYINNGKGLFSKAPKSIFDAPNYNGSVACKADINKDGYMDIFVGGRVIPGQYPKPESSYIMMNHKGHFKLDKTLLPENIGIVRDAHFMDINVDNQVDLVVAGEWENIHALIQKGDKFLIDDDYVFEQKRMGWWQSILPFDIDNDGDLDILAGNIGQNTKFENNKNEKIGVIANDFDNNGTFDIVLSKDYKGKKVPVRGLQCTAEQLPYIKRKFNSYEGFAKADLKQILGYSGMKEGLNKSLTETQSGVFVNEGGQFSFTPFSKIAQISPILKFLVHDIENDKTKDIIFAGNVFDTEVETPRWDSGNGMVLLNSSKKNEIKLESTTINESGLNIPGDFRDMTQITLANGKTILVALNNNDKLQIFNL